jgi:endonuclease VIII
VPEGDTIYRTARALQRAIGGKLCTGFETGLAPLARVNDDTPLTGRTIERVEARGKWLLIYFSPAANGSEALILVTHMLMSGSWHLYRTGERWQMGKDRMRAVIRTADWQAVAFNVPVAEFHTARSLARHAAIPKLGIDVLSMEYNIESAVAKLKGYAAENPTAEIAIVLLNQRVLAGLGNVYKSEVLFAAGVNPFRAISTLTNREFELIAETAQKWMKVNVLDGADEGIITYGGNRRTVHTSNSGERNWVYRRRGQECRRCGDTIQMRKQGEQARSTYWCPACQP